MVRYIVFGGVSSYDFGAVADGSQSYVIPDRDIQTISIPGRNGDLTIDNKRYLNVEIVYTLYFGSSLRMDMYKQALSSIFGYQRLEDSKRPEEFRIGRLKSAVSSVSGVESRHGKLTLTFDCKPQRFLKIGEVPTVITGHGTLKNPTGLTAYPLIRMQATKYTELDDIFLDFFVGDCKVGVDAAFLPGAANQTNGVLFLDCDTKDVYFNEPNETLPERVEPAWSLTRITNYKFPELGAGETEVSFSEWTGTLTIWPRWWTL